MNRMKICVNHNDQRHLLSIFSCWAIKIFLQVSLGGTAKFMTLNQRQKNNCSCRIF